MTTAQDSKDEALFENRTEDEDLAPYEDEKKKNKDAERERQERERRENRLGG